LKFLEKATRQFLDAQVRGSALWQRLPLRTGLDADSVIDKGAVWELTRAPSIRMHRYSSVFPDSIRQAPNAPLPGVVADESNCRQDNYRHRH
jgi:hypothetical protein